MTRYEPVNGVWHVVVEDIDLLAVEAEMSRLRASYDAAFIGPYKIGDKYVAKGMLHAAPLG